MIDSIGKIVDNEIMRFLVYVMLILFTACGDPAVRRDILFPIRVDPDQTQLSGNICSTHFTVTNLSKGQEYSLIWLQVALQDQNGFSYRKIYDFNELASILQQPQLPPAVQMSIALDIDISGSELILPPFEGTLQMIGVGFHESVIFSGLLNCQ